jgi:hypothetical protein
MASDSVWRSAARQLPLRLPVGTFFLDSVLSKRGADQATVVGLQQFATTAYPFLGKLDVQQFVRLLSARGGRCRRVTPTGGPCRCPEPR